MIIVSYNNSNPIKYLFLQLYLKKYPIFAKDSIIKEE